MTSEAQKRASRRYDRENTMVVTLKLNKKYDADIIEYLEKTVENRQAYIKALIRKDIKREARKAAKIIVDSYGETLKKLAES